VAITQVTSLSLVQTAFEKLAYFSLRPELFYMALVSVKPSNETNNGLTVQFQLTSDLPAAISPIAELTDITPVAPSDTNVTVTALEYGNAVQTSARLRAGTYMDVNPIIADIVGWNAGISLDTIARATFQAGSQVRIASNIANRNLLSGSTTLNSSNLQGADVRNAVAKLRAQNVRPFGPTYKGIIHPDVATDFKGVTGGTNWSDPHVYSDPSNIYQGVIGNFQSVQFMESSRAPLFPDVGNGSGSAGAVDAYGTLIVGQQAVAMAFSQGGGYTGGAMPTYVDIPVIDVLRRFEGVGWKWLGGFGVFRQAALMRIESSATTGQNT
jgi:N4-gp56 family major capsid protein